ncbi:hypothetical protein BHE74_00027103 [Ensete ventricosum]|nr:hypothetical protein BHE74_00027103 [Ensete ventricosum]
MASFHYASPPPPPPDVIPPPQSRPSRYCSPSPTSTPSPSSNSDPPSSPPLPLPLPTAPPPASEPPSAPLDAFSPPPKALSPPPPESHPPLSSPPPPVLPLSPSPAVMPTILPIYYQSPPPPPPSHVPPLSSSPLPPAPPSLPPSGSAPLSSLAPLPKVLPPSPSPSISNCTPPVSSPVPHGNLPSLPSATPVKPNAAKSTNPTKNAGSIKRSSSSPRGTISTAESVATFAVVAGLVMLTFVGAAVWLVRKRKKPVEPLRHGGNLAMASMVSSHMSELSHSRSSNPLVRHGSGVSYGFPYSALEPGLGHTKLWFTLEELSLITNDFSTQNLLGRGGSCCVYKGLLLDGREVAVKQLKVDDAQGEREFKAEVAFAGKGRPVMEWTIRLKVAAGAARGMAYLHEDCNFLSPFLIIHRDIKSSNILLDYNFEAQVSDFGLAKSAMDTNTHVTTQVMGTFGYLAPEYARSGKLTAKSDVYSFGVVLLELITGRKPVDRSQPLGDESLVEWVNSISATFHNFL